MSKTATSAARN